MCWKKKTAKEAFESKQPLHPCLHAQPASAVNIIQRAAPCALQSLYNWSDGRYQNSKPSAFLVCLAGVKFLWIVLNLNFHGLLYRNNILSIGDAFIFSRPVQQLSSCCECLMNFFNWRFSPLQTFTESRLESFIRGPFQSMRTFLRYL